MSTQKLPKTPGIYVIINSVNHHMYVGSTKNLASRYAQHLYKLRNGKHDNSHLQRAYDLYGADAFAFCVIDHLTDTSKLVEREQLFLDFIRPEYNIAPFANSPVLEEHSPEHIEKRMASRKATMEAVLAENPDAYSRTFTPETIEKILETRRAKRALDPSYGVRPADFEPSLEARSKMSAAHRGKKKSPEHVEKMRANQLGKELSPVTKAKISVSSKGRKQSPEQIEKRVASRKATMDAKLLENPDAYKFSPETIARRSATTKSRNQADPSRIERRSITARARNAERRQADPDAFARTPEHKAKLSEAKKGQKLSPVSIAKREATKKARREAGEYAPVTRETSPDTIAKRNATRRANEDAKFKALFNLEDPS